MSDRLSLSCRVRGSTDLIVLRHFEKMLSLFPFSKLAPRGPVLRTYVLEHAEPPAAEREFELGATAAELVAIARESFQADCLVEIDTAWDLWQFDGEWRLRPAPVQLCCYGSRFDNDEGDHLRVEFGPDAQFLPDPAMEGSLARGQSNLKSLLRFVSELEKALPLESRQLMSESGVNFAGVVRESLTRFQ
jgi:hypothetical protein